MRDLFRAPTIHRNILASLRLRGRDVICLQLLLLRSLYSTRQLVMCSWVVVQADNDDYGSSAFIY